MHLSLTKTLICLFWQHKEKELSLKWTIRISKSNMRNHCPSYMSQSSSSIKIQEITKHKMFNLNYKEKIASLIAMTEKI